jgi:hypothetical protein
MVNVVGHQPTLKAEVPFQAISCRIYGGEGDTGRFFSKYFCFCVSLSFHQCSIFILLLSLMLYIVHY